MKRPCLTCGTPTTGTYCPTHRKTTTQRGYGTAHRQARTQLARTLPALCGYGCGRLLTAESRWVAAHRVDSHPEYGYLAACPSCNERAKLR